MKLTKKLEAEILHVYNAYWDGYLRGDVENMTSLLDSGYTQVGSAETEVFSNKTDAVTFLYDTIDQIAGKLEMRNRSTKLEQRGNLILVHELCDVYALADAEWIFYSKFRASTLMRRTRGGWKILHQHSSFPDVRTGEGENIATEKIAAENQQLREAVKRRTIELEQKNRELEIETALERVRAVAMGMKEPADMLEICRTISRELQTLGVKNIRNVQTAIFYPQRSTYMNYEYYAKHKKTFITETAYTNNRIHKAFAMKMLKGKGEFFTTHIKGNKVKEWLAYQKTTNVFIDRYLEKASSLNYYWYSLGPVALGISTYAPLSKEELDLFQHFLNVFELAYTRYLDIEQAHAQAREAQIQASLEKVRAQALGMRKPEDLPDVCEVLFKELQTLGFSELRNAMVNIHNDEKETFLNYDYSDVIGKSITPLFYSIHPVIEKQIKQIRSARDAFSETVFKGKDLQKWKEFRRQRGEKDDPRIKKITALHYYFYSIGTGSIGISSFSSIGEEKLKLLKRFRNVFDFAYKRYMDVAQAEAQAREARIEAALERVRAAAMSMRTSDDLKQVGETIFSELKSLGFADIRNTEILINNNAKESILSHYYSDYGVSGTIEVLYNNHPVVKKWANDMKKTSDAFAEVIVSAEEISAWRKYREEIGYLPDPKLNEAKSVWYYSYSTGLGALSVSSFSPVTEEQLKTLKRFRNVFGLAYRRYVDVAQAEAHARESKIELSLERVRARSMAMHKSDELVEAADVVFQQLNELGIQSIRAGIATFDAVKETITVWSRAHADSKKRILGVVPRESHPFFVGCFDAWKAKKRFYFMEFVGDEVVKYYRHMSSILSYSASKTYNSKEVFYTFFFPEGSVNVIRHERLTDDELDIMQRFATVFGLIYRRFLDLQKAEAQAREAQIEAALERVRSRSMAMQKSEELKEVITIVYQQLTHLKIKLDHSGFVVDYTPGGDWHFWIADDQDIPSKITHPYFESVWANQFNEAKEKGVDLFATHLNFEEKNKFYNELLSYVPGLPEASKQFYLSCPGLAASTVLLDNVGLYIENFSGTPYTDEENKILMRFGKVFQQTYTRFLDLQKAEAQAREAQIEAALERIRARAMAMHTSGELENVAHILREQMGFLGQPELETSVIDLFEEGSDQVVSWYAFRPPGLSSGKIVTGTAAFPWASSALSTEMMMAYRAGQQELTMEAGSEKAMELLRVLAQAAPEIGKYVNDTIPERVHYHLAFFSGGALLMVSYQPPSEEAKSLQRRAASVFDMAYRRYGDLKKAEAQAREAQIELSLEKIRAKVTAMKESSDLLDIVVTMRTEFVGLGNEAHYFWHMRWLPDKYEKAMTSGDGTRIGMVMTLPRHIHGDIKLVANWEESDDPTLIFPMDVDTAVEYVDKMIRLGDFQQVDPQAPTLDDIRHIGGLTFIMARTTHGEIGYSLSGPVSDPSAEAVTTLARFAGVFDLAYRRFEDLKIAEAQTRQAQLDLIQLQQAKRKAEDALVELRATQEQLLQQEKLASLGQLTAGIAHEIKNPLNFVNNFSSVSVELVDEAMEEIKKLSGGGEVQQLLIDVKKNLSKIIEHGTRADGIVKSMLQHSRGGSGKKEPTDLNALVKEYVNLAFHGMRAGKNPINVHIALELDNFIGKVPVIAEDFSRVVINLSQNAFDAMREKTNVSGKSYLPKLTARTRRDVAKVVLEIEDNGPGIPDAIKDKILQPFFTTKKGTQGTGLGLSITHDIVKAHGGEMRIETNSGGGATFIVTLDVATQG